MQDASKPIWFKKDSGTQTINLGEPEIKIYVATPVHSECSIHYTQALLKFQQACMMNNIMVSFSLLKSSLVTQGRNLCVANFLGDPIKYTHLLFIDSDIDFKFETIMKMLKLDKEVIATPYPMKHIHWDQIWERLQLGKIKSKDELMKAGYIFPIKMDNMIDPQKNQITVTDGVMEVSHAPTGCMLIKRQVFDKMIKAYPEDQIDQPTIVNGEAKSNPYMYNFFDTIHEPESKKYYGEDFGFCKKWTKIGGKCYCYIDDYITHVGEYQYNGRLKDNLEFVNTVDDSQKNK
jgi:hypothetical protein